MFRAARFARTAAPRFGTRAYSGGYTKEGYEASKEQAKSAVETWKKISIFLALPACAIFGVVATKEELDHIHHLEHDPPKFRKFPYGDGDHTPFWNPLTNPDPVEE
ncbi:cytochrome c oxidase, subunit VIa [Linderina pennispora]|uniref:Cytochrome c oxidase, subunit VIa n=1 Tax=Linderina pennispora TaxID=61395 RepID=A0A1Y1W2G1_9FUNG|nr:cytochrome c oxidase, subunit VIa [Linderina pennispora]ORX67592.1 cytochrome c oxidase, subunit VIa [Linderina pennispora]